MKSKIIVDRDVTPNSILIYALAPAYLTNTSRRNMSAAKAKPFVRQNIKNPTEICSTYV